MRILLVEDDPQLRTSVTRGLREAGYDVDEAADGVEALERAAANTHDCIILDILLPRRDGIHVCRELRARHNWVPIHADDRLSRPGPSSVWAISSSTRGGAPSVAATARSS